MSGGAEPGAYPGNLSLPREVRDKILSTFRHTLNLYKEGKTDDCLIGCDFILKMDPRFAPARQLIEKAKNPANEIDVASLEAIVAETPSRPERVATPETDRLIVRAAESFNARDFDAAIAAAEQVLQVLPGNQDAAQILEKARQKKSAQPQFEVARQRAIAALDGHRASEARAALDKMRSLDPEHPAVALLDRRLAAPAPAEVGESTNPGFAITSAAPGQDSGGRLGDLSLDSLSLDDSSPAVVLPPAGMGNPATGPLSRPGNDFSDRFSGPAGGAPDLWSEAPADQSGLGDLSLDATPEPAYAPEPGFAVTPESVFPRAPEPKPPAPEPPSQQQEIDSLLQRGDEAGRTGNRQQAIEIWSRIFLIDINNSEAVGRIENTRREMSEGNKRVAEGLKRGREAFEAADFTGAREAFLEVLALDESDATARSYIDRIESELARPSSGLDLAKKTPQSDILSEEMAEAAELEPVAAPRPGETKGASRQKAPRDRKFLVALGAALLLAIGVGGYFLMKPGHGRAAAPGASEGGPSIEHATSLFRDGKRDETIAELKAISPQHPDYARAQKMLTTLTRNPSGDEAAGSPESAPAGKAGASASAPPPEALRQRQEAEKALAEKRYIDALTGFNLAASSFHDDPTFSQSLGAASEKVSELTPAVKLYNEAEYETAIPILWRIYQAERDNQDARSYLLRSYYNQGIAQLQNGLYPKAAESFKEVIAIAPADADAVRHKKFAERYRKGDLDLMGRIYVRHVQQRP
jgi:tetratricopeptide (TPR) repeat protein